MLRDLYANDAVDAVDAFLKMQAASRRTSMAG
jgi:hypothetical protein